MVRRLAIYQITALLNSGEGGYPGSPFLSVADFVSGKTDFIKVPGPIIICSAAEDRLLN